MSVSKVGRVVFVAALVFVTGCHDATTSPASSSTTRATATSTTSPSAAGRPEALKACRTWANADLSPNPSALAAEAIHADAARDAVRAATISRRWSALARGMRDATAGPLTGVTPAQEAQFERGIAIVVQECHGLAVEIASSSTATNSQIKVYGDCTSATFEPVELILACADKGTRLEGLSWTTWTSTSATGVGTLVYDDCEPDCAQGHIHSVPGTKVSLTTPVPDPTGQPVWSQVQEDPQPPGYATGPYHGGPQPLPTQPD